MKKYSRYIKGMRQLQTIDVSCEHCEEGTGDLVRCGRCKDFNLFWPRNNFTDAEWLRLARELKLKTIN